MKRERERGSNGKENWNVRSKQPFYEEYQEGGETIAKLHTWQDLTVFNFKVRNIATPTIITTNVFTTFPCV